MATDKLKPIDGFVDDLINESWRDLYIESDCKGCGELKIVSKRDTLCDPCEAEMMCKAEALKAYKKAVARLPSALQGVTKAGLNLSHPKSNAVKVIEAITKTDRSIYIAGEVGRGKTTLAAWLYKMIGSKGHNVRWVTSKEIVNKVGEAYSFSVTESPSDVIDWFASHARAGTLFIDDIGNEKIDKKSVANIRELIDNIYGTRDRSRIVISSNKGIDELRDLYSNVLDSDAGEMIGSRLVEMCDLFTLTGPDWRVEKRKR